MNSIVLDVLNKDNEYIDNFEKSILYGLSDIKEKRWDFSLPTIVREKSICAYKLQCNTDEEFKKLFFDMFPFLKNLDFKGLLVAGGCISNALRGYLTDNFDIDIFIYGISKEEAYEKLINIIRSFNPKYLIFNDNYVECSIHNVKIQFITTIKKNINEILYSFDLGSSAVGFDGEKLYFSEMGKFAYEYGCNIVSSRHMSSSYEYRLMKYLDRNMYIILPDLDMTKVKGSYIHFPRFPYLHVYRENILIIHPSSSILCKRYKVTSLYDNLETNLDSLTINKDFSSDNKVKGMLDKLTFINIKRIIKKMDMYGIVINENGNIMDSIDKYINGSIKQIRELYLLTDNFLTQYINLCDKVKTLEGIKYYGVNHLFTKEDIETFLSLDNKKFKKKFNIKVNEKIRNIIDNVMLRVEEIQRRKTLFNIIESTGKFEIFRQRVDGADFYGQYRK